MPPPPPPKRARLTPPDAPHAREHCPSHVYSPPINDASHLLNVRHCAKCFCYVCDRPVARCPVWPLHCMALHAEPKWRLLRHETRAGRNVLPVPSALLPARARHNFSVRRFVVGYDQHSRDDVELIDLTVEHTQPHSDGIGATEQTALKPVGATDAASVCEGDDNPSQVDQEEQNASDVSTSSLEEQYSSQPDDDEEQDSSHVSASSLEEQFSSQLDEEEDQSAVDVSPSSLLPASPVEQPPLPVAPPALAHQQSPLASTPSAHTAAFPAHWRSPPHSHSPPVPQPIFSSPDNSELHGHTYDISESSHLESHNGTPWSSVQRTSRILSFTASDELQPSDIGNGLELAKIKELWKVCAPLNLRLPAKMRVDASKQQHAGADWTRLFVGHIDLWRPYCSHLSATHIQQTLGRADADVASLFSPANAHINGCTKSQVSLIAREMGLDLTSDTLINELQWYSRAGVDWPTINELSTLPNYTYDDKKAVPADVICSLESAMGTGLIEVLWSISHHGGHDNENLAFSRDVSKFINRLPITKKKHIVRKQFAWLQKRRSQVNKLHHLDCSNCCRLRLKVYITPKAFGSVSVNAANFCADDDIYTHMAKVDGGSPRLEATVLQLLNKQLSHTMTKSKRTRDLQAIFALLQPVESPSANGEQVPSSTTNAPEGPVPSAKLYDTHSHFNSLTITYRDNDTKLRNSNENMLKQLEKICDEHNYDTNSESMHQALLRSDAFTVSNGYHRVENQPGNVKLQLRRYQLESLAWMIDREKQRSLSDPFWIAVHATDRSEGKRTLYYCPFTGALATVPPPPIVGGVLAEDMGLGKTIIVISLINNTITTARDSRCIRDGDRKDLIKSGATLVVCPVSLLKQWEREFNTTLNNPMRVLTWYGPRVHDPAMIASFDVVLTTYGILACPNHEALTKINWYRVVIDESTYLRGGASNCAHVLSRKLVSSRRWAVSGTPFGNQFSSFRGTMEFLGVVPFSSSNDFDFISSPFATIRTFRRYKQFLEAGKIPHKFLVLPLLAFALKSLVMRHVKDLKFRGCMLVELPPAIGRLVKVKSGIAEKSMYKKVEAKIQNNAYNRLSNEGQFAKNVLPLLTLLMPIRMIADGIVPQSRPIQNGKTTVIAGYNASASGQQLPGGVANGAKIKQLISDITTYRMRDTGNKFVVFTGFCDVQKAIKHALDGAGHMTLTLEGGMSATKRGKVIQKFAEDSDVAALVLSMRLGACGLTLTMANVVVLFEVGVDYALELQAVNRIHRIGQTRPIETVTYVCEGTVDERVMIVRRRRGLPMYFGDSDKTKKDTEESQLTKLEEMRILYDWQPR